MIDPQHASQIFEMLPLDTSQFGTYEKWAQNFFSDETVIFNPYLDVTLQLDITEHKKAFENLADKAGGTFSCYLYYTLIQALKNHPEFFYRKFNETWYEIKNPALFFPIARAEKKDRFYEALVYNIFKSSWPQFSADYQKEISLSKLAPKQVSDIFEYCLFIGNLPNLQFTGLTLHTNSRTNTQPFFYFGKRYEQAGKQFTSLCLKFHHSTVDPYIVDLLIRDFNKILTF